MNTLSSYELSDMADIVMKCYEGEGKKKGKQFVKILKNRYGQCGVFEVLNMDLNDSTMMLKEVIGLSEIL
jgi:hypothetical protein